MKILLLRNMGDQVNINNYNVQEIGLAKTLVKRGHQCDVVLYSNTEKYKKEKIQFHEGYITIHWVKAFKIYYNAIYFKLIKEKFFDNYDMIQTHEYTQVMTCILPFVTKKTRIIFHGPYQDIRNGIIQRLYDFIFLPIVRKKYDFVLAKSKLSEKYLLGKGFKKVESIGVGLDTNRLIDSVPFRESSLYSYRKRFEAQPTLLYIGKIEERRNIIFLLEIIHELNKTLKFNFLLIGDGEKQYKKKCFEKINELELNDTIIYLEKINQNEIKYAYEMSELLVFPSKYEIFGMVLLESMYFNCPVLSSYNGGSSVLLQDNYPEMIMRNYDVEQWVNGIISILNNNIDYKLKEYIEKNYTWDAIGEKFENKYNCVMNMKVTDKDGD